MKKTLLLSLSCLLSHQFMQAQTFSDDFEAYNAGAYLGPQSPNWTTWSNADGGTEDVNVVTTAAHSGTKSIYFTSTSATGGPTDCVLPFQGPHNTGQFVFTAWFNVGVGKNGYFNFQASNTTGQQWSIDCFMNADSSLVFSNSGTTMLTATYPQNAWFELKVDANLNSSLWNVSVNGTSVGVYHNPVYKIASIDIYPVDASSSFWVDDVSYTHTPYTLPAVNAGLPLIGLTTGLGVAGQQRTPTVEFRNLGTTAITSYDIVFGNNGVQTTQNITGVNIASLGTANLASTTPITLVAGANTIWAKITNVNGTAGDGDNTDDSISITMNIVQPAAGKMVIAEEGTGTWCGWCPRGAVALANMEKYPGYFQGLAVHNGDPMTNDDYDAAIGGLISGYPSALVDRGTAIDPTGIEADFLQRIILAPKALLVNGATYNASTHELKVSVTTTFQQAVTGDFRIACALAEDSIKGTVAGYNQANYYSSTSQNIALVGAGHNWQTSPNPIPAAQMQYDHVARLISPAFDGFPNSFPASVSQGAVYTHNFTLILDPTWKSNYIHIVGMLIDPTGKIENASSTTIAEAINHGFINGTDVTVGITTFDAPDQQIKLFPNPVSNTAFVQVQLGNQNNVSMEIYNVNGTLLSAKNYGKLSNAYTLPINTEQFSAGVYFVKIYIDGKPSVIKFVKE